MSLNLDPIRFPRGRMAVYLFCLSWFSALAWWHRRVVMDDPWITFRYARNLLEGHGLVFNVGERLEGYSNFSWVFVSALGMFLQVEPLSFTRAVSWIIAAAILAVLCFGWRRKIPGGIDDTPNRSAIGALFLASCFPFAVWTMGGLETILQTGALLALALGLERCWSGASWKGAGVAWGALVLLMLTRPEGFFWIAAALLVLLLAWRRANSRKALLAVLAGFLAAFAVYTAWRVSYFGSFWPNTVAAKVGGGPLSSLWRGIAYLWSYFGSAPFLILTFAAYGLWKLWKQWRRNHSLTGEHRLVIVLAITGGGQLAFALGTGGDWMPAGRFLVPALPVLCVLAAVSIRGWPLFVRLVAAGFLLLSGLVLAYKDPPLRWCRWAPKEAGEALLVQPIVDTGKYLHRIAPPDAFVAATEAGAIPYYSGLGFIDMLGLVDAHIASLPGGLHEKYDADYVLSREPMYIVLGITDVDGEMVGTWEPDRQILAHEAFSREYQSLRRISRFMPDGEYSQLLPGFMAIYERRGAGATASPPSAPVPPNGPDERTPDDS